MRVNPTGAEVDVNRLEDDPLLLPPRDERATPGRPRPPSRWCSSVPRSRLETKTGTVDILRLRCEVPHFVKTVLTNISLAHN